MLKRCNKQAAKDEAFWPYKEGEIREGIIPETVDEAGHVTSLTESPFL
jgi:hypothetical protein